MERNECAESDYEKACRCITPPRNTPFGRNGIYEWGMDIMSVMNQEHHGLLVK